MNFVLGTITRSVLTVFHYLQVTKDMKQLDGKIIECHWDFQARGWKFMRQRTDKSFPNSFTTAQGESQFFAMYRRVVAITITNRRQSENFSYPEVLVRGSFAQEVIRT